MRDSYPRHADYDPDSPITLTLRCTLSWLRPDGLDRDALKRIEQLTGDEQR